LPVLGSTQLLAADTIYTGLAGPSPEVFSPASPMSRAGGPRAPISQPSFKPPVPEQIVAIGVSERSWAAQIPLCSPFWGSVSPRLPRSWCTGARLLASHFQETVEIFQQTVSNSNCNSFILKKCLFSLLRFLGCTGNWGGKQSLLASLPRREGEEGMEKSMRKLGRWFCFFLHTDCFSSSVKIQLLMLQCDGCWWTEEGA